MHLTYNNIKARKKAFQWRWT